MIKSLSQIIKKNAVQLQENKKEEGLLSLLRRFVEKMLEKLLGEDERSVKNAYDTKGATQRNTSNNDGQQQNIDQASSISINGRQFNLEPGKAFNYKDKALNINITYNSPETKKNLQQGGTSPNIANTINLNISGKEHNIYPGEFFDYKGPGLKISVVSGHQQSRDFDKVFSQDQSISKGLEQVTKLRNTVITLVNALKVNEVNTSH